ncbi:MAG: GNAT family N-acetyltransferase [Candidatus Rokubacteria bacterium]|nr:GNAT family N-acetyltransferase [Candidatus Rokubacteria bacterium]
MNNLTLRKAGQGDSDFAYAVRRAAFRQYVQKLTGWNEDEQRELHDQRLRTQDFRVINLAGIDVGIIAVAVAKDCMKVNQLLLLPEHQGKQIGRQCMFLLMDEARRLGLPIRLRVMKVNPRGLVFYERLGFARTAETDTHDLLEWAAHNSSFQATRCARG